MNLFNLFARYFWLPGIVMTGFNYFSSKRIAAASGPASPRASDEAKVLRRRLAVVLALPWVVMGVGTLVGGVPDIWRYFRPQDQNPYVLAWFGTIFSVAILFAWWVFFFDGAEKSIKYQLFETFDRRSNLMNSVGRIKLFAALGPIWIILWITIVVSMGVPLPH